MVVKEKFSRGNWTNKHEERSKGFCRSTIVPVLSSDRMYITSGGSFEIQLLITGIGEGPSLVEGSNGDENVNIT